MIKLLPVPAVIGICVFLMAPALTHAQISDIEAPQLRSISFSPTAVDVRTAQQQVFVKAEFTDNLSGVSYGYARFTSPGGFSLYAYLYLSLGTPLSGTFSGNTVLKPGMEAGNWSLAQVYLIDMVGNSRSLSDAALSAIIPLRDLSVQSFPDTTKPRITALRITPRAVDVSAGDQMVTVEIDWTDDIVGLWPPTNSSLFMFLRSPAAQQRVYAASNEWSAIPMMPPTTSDPRGTLRIQRLIPKSSEPGTWRVENIGLYDPLGRQQYWTTAELISAGLDPFLNVTSSSPDVTPPVISDITVLPGFVNTTLASQQVTAGMKISDTGSGVTFDPTTVTWSFFYTPWFVSPSGQQSARVYPPRRRNLWVTASVSEPSR